MSRKIILKSKIIERLETILAEGDLRANKFAEIIGYSPGVVSGVLNEKLPITDKFINAVCFKMELSEEWLRTGEGPMKKEGLSSGKETTRREVIPAQTDFPADDFVFIRQVNGKISAGGGLMPDDSADIECAFRKDWIKRRGCKSEKMSLIKVSGDSMAPTLLSGDLVLVDHSRTTIAPNGGVYALSIDHEIMIKRIQVLFPQSKLRILSDNPHYDTIEADPDEVTINGKVIWFGRNME